jgi:hypothetical protein
MRFISVSVVVVAAGTLQGVVGSVIKTFTNTSVAEPTPDLGINCRGNSQCGIGRPSNTAQVLESLICGIDPSTFFYNGQQVACVTSICAFLQNSNGGTAGTLCSLADRIVRHSCSVCGSVPTGYPASNG